MRDNPGPTRSGALNHWRGLHSEANPVRWDRNVCHTHYHFNFGTADVTSYMYIYIHMLLHIFGPPITPLQAGIIFLIRLGHRLFMHHRSTRPVRVSASAEAARLMYCGAAEAIDSVHVNGGRTGILCKSGNRFAALTGMIFVASRCRTSSATIA